MTEEVHLGRLVRAPYELGLCRFCKRYVFQKDFTTRYRRMDALADEVVTEKEFHEADVQSRNKRIELFDENSRSMADLAAILAGESHYVSDPHVCSACAQVPDTEMEKTT